MTVHVFYVTDATTRPAEAIMDALREAQRVPPGTTGVVMLTAGSYGLEKTVKVPDGSTLIGEPNQNVTFWPKEPSDGTHMCIPGSRCFIQGITFSGRENEDMEHTIKCHLFGVKGDREIKQLNIMNCQFVDAARIGSKANWDCCSFKCSLARGVAFDSCVFDKGDRMCLTLGEGSAEKFRFRNCSFGASRYWSVDLEPTHGRHINDVMFIECQFDGHNVNDGIMSISLDTSAVRFTRCVFRAQPGANRKIRIQAQPAGTPSNISFVDCFGIGARVFIENKFPNDPVPLPAITEVRTCWYSEDQSGTASVICH